MDSQTKKTVPKTFDYIEDINLYAGLANRTLADNVRDGTVVQTWPAHAAMALNASSGLASESGEVNEIVKKWLFHGHPMDAATEIHLKKELGDSMWYWALTCYAFNFDPAEILAMNIEKLRARYPDGFETARSINRAKDDI